MYKIFVWVRTHKHTHTHAHIYSHVSYQVATHGIKLKLSPTLTLILTRTLQTLY